MHVYGREGVIKKHYNENFMARLNMYKIVFSYFLICECVCVITRESGGERECSEMAARYDKAFLMTSHCMMQTTCLSNLLSPMISSSSVSFRYGN